MGGDVLPAGLAVFDVDVARHRKGGQTEVEHILGFMLGKAEKAKIPCNTLLLAYTNVKAFEQRRAAGRLS
jgi:ketopantoate reductase